jgi:predicted ATPase
MDEAVCCRRAEDGVTSVRNGKRDNGAGRKSGAAGASDLSPLDALTIAGFKSIRDSTRIALRPLTVLAGQNSSGKSSAMQPLLLLKQTLDAPYDQGPLRLDGENAHFNSAEQLFWKERRQVDRGAEFRVGLEEPNLTVTLVFRRAKRGVLLDRMEYSDDTGGHVLREDEPVPPTSLPQFLETLVNERKAGVRVVRDQWLLELHAEYGEHQRRVLPLGSPAFAFRPLIAHLVHVPGLRGEPRRFYPATQVGGVFPGVFSPYTASVVAAWGESHDDSLTRLGDWLARLGLTWKAQARALDDTRVELRVGRLTSARRGGADDLVNIADVGFGVSQVLPVLVALLVAKPGQIVYLEQPEIHLHPKAQVALAACLLEAARRGVRVVAETHSHLVLRGIQEQIAAGKYPASLVALHWFARDAAGATHVTSADLDRDGAFGDWPEDLSATELEIEDRYLRHVAPRA